MIDDTALYRRARETLNPRRLSPSAEAGGVGCALVTEAEEVYVGVCLDTGSSMGFCAEHNAIGSMITNGESRILTIVAVNWDGEILAPCGRCRELIFQTNVENAETRVLLAGDREATIRQLLPELGH